MTTQQQTPQAIRAAAARAYFPRGLEQPEGGYRFAVDSLLLACFLTPEPGGSLLDLGTGCGVVALAALCRRPDLQAWGVERERPLVEAARGNAALLGFGDRFRVLQGDMARDDLFTPGQDKNRRGALREAAFDRALANPPFRRASRGRTPASPLRMRALFEEEGALAAFCACAARALKPEGRCAFLYDAGREDFLLENLREAGLAPARLLAVRSLPDRAPFRILVEAAKHSQGTAPADLKREGPLTLYDENGKATPQARAFCPFI